MLTNRTTISWGFEAKRAECGNLNGQRYQLRWPNRRTWSSIEMCSGSFECRDAFTMAIAKSYADLQEKSRKRRKLGANVTILMV